MELRNEPIGRILWRDRLVQAALCSAILVGCGQSDPGSKGSGTKPIPSAHMAEVDTLRNKRTPRFAPRKDYVSDGYGDTVVWNPTRPLTWADYRQLEKDPTIVEWAAANTTMRLYCMPYSNGKDMAWDVRAVMKRDLSWVDPRHMKDSTLLDHERLHFDIAELYARNLRKYLATYKGPYTHEGAESLKVVLKQYNDSVFIEGEQYDRETEHHSNRSAQSRWQADVANRMRASEKFR